MVWTSAMLSKLWLTVSGGRNVATSTSTASRSRIERAYSTRLSRWKVRLPGFGLASAASSISAASDRARPLGSRLPAAARN